MYKIALLLFSLAFIISCSEDDGGSPKRFSFVFQVVDENGDDFFFANDQYDNPLENLLIETSPNTGVLLGGFEKCQLSDSGFHIYYNSARPSTVYFNYGNGDIDTLSATYSFEQKSDSDISSVEFCFNQEPCTRINLSIENQEDYTVNFFRFCSDTTLVYPLIKLMKK